MTEDGRSLRPQIIELAILTFPDGSQPIVLEADTQKGHTKYRARHTTGYKIFPEATLRVIHVDVAALVVEEVKSLVEFAPVMACATGANNGA